MNRILYAADAATDVMQVGNFIPFPAAQFIGKVGNMLGSGVDAFQAGVEARKGNVGSSAINYASGILPSVIKDPAVLGGYRRSAKYSFGNRSFYNPVDKRYGRMTSKQLMGNRALLGALGAETVYDAYQDGGQMIKRADGSYSRRGLWDNVRANTGSGKKPTAQMLEQERKIKAKNK
jgi:hypothetical protein